MDESERVIDYVKEAGEYIATSDGKRLPRPRCWNDFFLTGQCSGRGSKSYPEARNGDFIYYVF